MRLNALFRLAFAPAPPQRVNLATYRNSQAHSSKGTPSWPAYADDTSTVCKPTVSGTISLPSRGAFTFPSRYWFTIGRLGILRLTRWSSQIHAGFHGPGATWDRTQRLRVFRVRGYYPLRPDFPDGSTTQQLGNSVKDLVLFLVIPRPRISNATRLDTDTV
jgi:hypothetical protein